MDEVFNKVQVSFSGHKKAAAQLHRIWAASPDSFEDEFFACLACVLEVYKREPAAERVVEFVVEFATQSSEEEAYDEAFMQSLCMRLLRLAHAKDKAVRFRVAQLVCRMLNSMAEDAEVSDELFEAVEEAMVVRCRDKVPLVRAWALRALFRLQNPLDASDEITVELLRLMATDGSKEVRMAAISTVAPSKHSIKAILARTRDVSEEVRLHALGVLAGKVEVRWLSISQRASLLQTGLQDRQPKVRPTPTPNPNPNPNPDPDPNQALALAYYPGPFRQVSLTLGAKKLGAVSKVILALTKPSPSLPPSPSPSP